MKGVRLSAAALPLWEVRNPRMGSYTASLGALKAFS